MGYRILGAIICLGICMSTWALDLNEQRQFDIPAQKLSTALVEFSRQAKAPIVSSTPDVERFDSPGVSGRMSLKEALKALLQGTGLDIRTTESGAIAIGSFGARFRTTDSAPADATRMAQLYPDAPRTSRQDSSAATPTVPSAEAERTPLGEIIVTAQKRQERLQDVPVPVSIVNAEVLANNNQSRLQDYFTTVPGLSVAPISPSVQFLSIRGISTGSYTNPTVGVVVDDVPIGSSTDLGGGYVVPDIDPADLSRIEVLRGPQGTLYGASSLGGLIKYVTLDPSTDAVSGHAQADVNEVFNGAEAGYAFRASVNVPVNDTLAFRVSGFARQDPGYINNPVLHINGINEEHVSGGRISVLWRPSEGFSAKLGALYQDSSGDGNNDVDIQSGLGDLQQRYPRNIGVNHRTLELYSATLKATLGAAELTSVTGYSINKFADSQDYTQLLGSYSLPQFGFQSTPLSEANTTYKLTQEVRLAMPLGRQFDWLLGGFYTHEDSPFAENIFAENGVTDTPVGEWLYISFPTTYQEYAGFTDLTWHATDRFDIQLGGRESRIKQRANESDVGIYDEFFLGKSSPYILPQVDTDSSAFTYLVAPKFKLTPDLMLYARVASGYRAGGPNAAPEDPREYSPDKTQNYELGIKADWLEHALSLDSSLYYVDWKNIQVSLTDPTTGFGYYVNASRAKSQGIELSVQAKPVPGLTIAGWVTWSDAALTQPFPALSSALGASGDRLPFSSKFSGNLSLEDELALNSAWRGFAGAVVSYVGDRQGDFTATGVRQDLPGYAKADLHIGVKYDAWTTGLYLNNAFDRRGLLMTGQAESLPYAYIYIQPRTVGLSITRAF